MLDKGSGHMSFVSTIIGTAERVPLPDAIIRAAIHRLCSRTAARVSPNVTPKPTRFSPTRWRRAPSPNTPTRPTRSTTKCRRRSLPKCSGRTANIRPASTRRRLHLAGGRGRGTAPDRGACRARRRPADPRARLRLGLAVAVDGAAVSRSARSRRCRIRHSQREYIEAEAANARPGQPARHHRRHERVRHRANASTASSRSRCSST